MNIYYQVQSAYHSIDYWKHILVKLTNTKSQRRSEPQPLLLIAPPPPPLNASLPSLFQQLLSAASFNGKYCKIIYFIITKRGMLCSIFLGMFRHYKSVVIFFLIWFNLLQANEIFNIVKFWICF